MSKNKSVPFQGIVAVGNTDLQAINRYRMLAMGKGAQVLTDSGKTFAFVSNASADMERVFNPKTGDLDLEESTDILNGLQFEAKAGDTSKAFHHHCSDGCGIHLVYDSLSFVERCPICTTSISIEAQASDEDEADEGSADEEMDTDSADVEGDDDMSKEDEVEVDEDEVEDEVESEDESGEDDEELEETEDDESGESDDDEEESEDDESSDDDEESEDDEEETSVEDEPLVVAASSKEEALRLYSKERSGTALASSITSVDYLVCASAGNCGAHVITETVLANCPNPVCGKPLSEPVEAVASDDDADEPEDTDMSLVEDGSEEDADEADAACDVTASADATKSDAAKSDEPKEKVTPKAKVTTIEAPAEPALEAPAVQKEVFTEAPKGNAKEVLASGEDCAMSDEATSEEVEVDSLEEMDDEASADDMDVSFSASVAGKPLWTAFVKGVPVAIASQADAGSNADIFTDKRFGMACIASAKIAGPKKILKELGFKGIKSTLKVSNLVGKRVEEGVASAKKELAEEQAVFLERFNAALSTAGIGITRGFFQGEKNPVRESLAGALATAGVRNPEVMVDAAISNSFEPFLKKVFAKAAELMAKPLEVQESFSRSVLEVSYMPSKASASSLIEDRLGNIGSAVASDNAVIEEKSNTVVASANDFDAKLSRVVSGLGRSFHGNNGRGR